MRVTEGPDESTPEERKEQFRQLIAPAIHRVKQLSLDEAEAREVIEEMLPEL